MSDCACNLCKMSRALRRDPLDREEVEAAYDAVFEDYGWECQRLSYLLGEVRRFCGRLDAPSYLREALAIAAENPTASVGLRLPEQNG